MTSCAKGQGTGINGLLGNGQLQKNCRSNCPLLVLTLSPARLRDLESGCFQAVLSFHGVALQW